MTPERMEQIGEILEKALALDPEKRGKYLDAHCANDSELRSEVESLLASHERAGSSFLNAPAAVPGENAVRSFVQPGRRIGPYLVEKKIGHGGMGEVFSAVRADGQYEKKVAIKLVRSGYDTESILERFRNERQILASLDHPNIGRLLDGGTTDEGIPYLVMELVEGAPIDDYCDQRKLNITARLQLFRQVCGAVQYAHQRLVIHRDLKPSNILVTPEGSPKLLDFGIAKLLDASGSTEVTLLRPMTPEYASPEQIRGESITTATDVYSLGVVLYQMLTGHAPYHVDTHTPARIADAITHEEPERPSTSVKRTESVMRYGEPRELTPESVSSTRENSPIRLQRRLRGDLDFILLKALRKEPSLRYASVAEFAEDIRNHLERLPVRARKGTWSYRAGKFIRRHRAGVAAAVLVLATLVTGVIVTLREARIAEANRRRAEARFNDVRKLANSLIFEIHDSIQDLPGATPSRKLLLDRAVEYLDKLSAEAAGDPDLERELAWGYQRLAVVQGNSEESNLGNVEAALTSDRKALRLFEAVAEARPNDTIDQLNVAMMHRILSFSELMDAGGRENLEKAMAITERVLRVDPQNPKVKSERSIEHQNMAIMYDGLGDRARALEGYLGNLELKQDILRTNPDYRGIQRGIAMATGQLGTEQAQLGRRKEALASLDKSIDGFLNAIKIGAPPDAVREAAVARIKKCDVQLMEEDLAGASESLREASQTIQPMAKSDPENVMLQFDVIGLEFERGVIQTMEKKFNEAANTLQSVYRSYAEAGASADVPLSKGAIQLWLGEAEMGRRNFATALQDFQKAASELVAPEGKPLHDDARGQLAESYVKSGRALLMLGKAQEATRMFQKGLETSASSLAPALQDVPAYYAVADAYAGLGDAAAAQARAARTKTEQVDFFTKAEESYSKSLEYWKKIPNPSTLSPGIFLVQSQKEVAQNVERTKRQLEAARAH